LPGWLGGRVFANLLTRVLLRKLEVSSTSSDRALVALVGTAVLATERAGLRVQDFWACGRWKLLREE